MYLPRIRKEIFRDLQLDNSRSNDAAKENFRISKELAAIGIKAGFYSRSAIGENARLLLVNTS